MALGVMLSGTAFAQVNPDADAPVTVLHSYTNLIQVPVLVLRSSHKPLPPIAASKFGVSLNDGPVFRATHVRPEGDDPIALSILLDEGGSGMGFEPTIQGSIANLVPGSLHASDRVSIYVLGC